MTRSWKNRTHSSNRIPTRPRFRPSRRRRFRAVSCSSTSRRCAPSSCAAARGRASTSKTAPLPHKAERVAMEEVRRGLVYYDVPPPKPRGRKRRSMNAADDSAARRRRRFRASASSTVFVLALFIGFCVVVGFTKTKKTAGGTRWSSRASTSGSAISRWSTCRARAAAAAAPADQLRSRFGTARTPSDSASSDRCDGGHLRRRASWRRRCAVTADTVRSSPDLGLTRHSPAASAVPG